MGVTAQPLRRHHLHVQPSTTTSIAGTYEYASHSNYSEWLTAVGVPAENVARMVGAKPVLEVTQAGDWRSEYLHRCGGSCCRSCTAETPARESCSHGHCLHRPPW